jgi:hypothetical protein
VTTAAHRLYARSPAAVKTAWRRTKRAYRTTHAHTHLLPDFLIIGAKRAGTSSLYTYLRRNVHVGRPSRKEIHYFDFNYHRGPDWYRCNFPTVLDKLAAEARYLGRFVTGESTPYYLFHPLVPGRVRETVPNVKLIALLRNPVDRAYSHYHLQCRYGNERLSFEEAIARESERIDDREEPNLAHRNFSYLARGVYVDQLERWFALFPCEQILVLRSEDLFEEPIATMHAASDFLGVRRRRDAAPRPYNAASYPDLAPETRAFLGEYYREPNRRLYELLGRDFGWEREAQQISA